MAIRTEPQHVPERHELDEVARALNVLDVDTQEGIIKAAVKPVVHCFMETGDLGRIIRTTRRKRISRSTQKRKITVHTWTETLATSWITQIGEEGLSETEAMGSFFGMNEQRKRTWAQAQ